MIEAHAFSRYFRRTAPRLADWQAPALTVLSPQALRDAIDVTAQHHALPAALRICRQALMCRLIQLDVGEQAPVDEITCAISSFAEVACEAASAHAQAELSEVFGRPARPLLVAGMGKLGAAELNVSSDIDLVYLYETDGDVGSISHHEWYSRAARRTSQILEAADEFGFVFRVDTRLRPNGDEGPSVCSLDMLEQYLAAQGRPWERFAWMRARLLGDVPPDVLRDWQAVVQPFVYRKYSDFGMLESLRALHAQIRTDARARAARNPAMGRDVKRSRGGIRELEFFVQLLQLVRGGVAPELRERHTRRAIHLLCQHGLIEAPLATGLDTAYTFLRRLENRVQYLDDAQTHVLPADDADLERIAQSMALQTSCELLCQFDEHREIVANAFDSVLTTLGAGKQAKTGCTACGKAGGASAQGTQDEADLDRRLRAMTSGMEDSDRRESLLRQLTAVTQSLQVRQLAPVHRSRLDRVLLHSLEFTLERGALRALGEWLDWLMAHAGRTNYLAFFDEHPQAVERLLRLFDACNFAARYVRRFPGVVDELVAPQAAERFDPQAYRDALTARLLAVEHAYPGDVEGLLDAVRRAYQLEVFRLVMRDIEQHPAVEAVSDDLSALADMTLAVVLDACWRNQPARHRGSPRLALIGYGKLGSKELGYASDLDLVMIHDDDHPDAIAIYTAFVRKLIHWLTVPTGAGKLFEIDTRLRPNGNAGLLVTSFTAFEEYQRGRGGNTAWTWEHQALTKGRFVAGDVAIGTAFERVRREVLATPRDVQALREEVIAMRKRIADAHPPESGQFDLKHDRGGLVDAEFAVQFWVLAHGGADAALLANTGTIALMAAAARAGLVSMDEAQAAQAAYRELRAEQHRLKLQGAEFARVSAGQFEPQRDAIARLWQAALEASAPQAAPAASASNHVIADATIQ